MKFLNRFNFQEVTGPRKNYPDSIWLAIQSKINGNIIDLPLPPEPRKYWKIFNERVVIMNASEKAVVDAAEEEAEGIQLKEQSIQQKLRDIAIAELIADGVLDSNGNWIP